MGWVRLSSFLPEKELICVDVKLHGSLRRYEGDNSDYGLFSLEIAEKTTVRGVLKKLGIPSDRVKMVMLNGKGADLDDVLSKGDRIALFPPEMAFNTYVALYFRRDFHKNHVK